MPLRTSLIRASRPVDLVDDHDGPQTAGERLAQHEPRLRHDAFGRVHQQEAAVGHLEDALDFAAEVGVAGRVDEVDAIGLAVRRQEADGAVLAQNGDAALAFERVGIHDEMMLTAFQFFQFTGAKVAGLLEQIVHQSRLAVIDVGDNCDITDIRSFHCLDCFLPEIFIIPLMAGLIASTYYRESRSSSHRASNVLKR